MKSKDYIPGADDAFDMLQTNIMNTVSTKVIPWQIQQSLISDLSVLATRWTTAYTAYRNTALRTPAVTQEKNDARKAYVSALRNFIQGQLMRNVKVTDADRRAMGLPVYDRTPTTPGVPTSRPETEVDFSQMAQHVIHVRDDETKSTAKPEHVAGFELWRKIGGDTTPSFEEMQLVEQVPRSPHALTYTYADRGKNVWYLTRWVNTRGEKGPWSEYVSAIVP
jgi:hypothetical protein